MVFGTGYLYLKEGIPETLLNIFVTKYALPKFIKGDVKSTASARSEVIVKSVMAISAT